MMQLADKQEKLPDFTRIKILMGDNPCYETRKLDTSGETLATFGYSTFDGCHVIAFPSYLFMHWKEAGINDFSEEVNNIRLAAEKKPRIEEAGWAGNIFSNFGVRPRLADLGVLHSDILDIRPVYPSPEGYESEPSGYMTMSQQVRAWSRLIDVEGKGFSCRLPLLLHARRLLFIQHDGFQQWFSSYFKAWEHFVPVKRDLSDLVERVMWAQNNSAEAQAIAEKAFHQSKQILQRQYAVKYIAESIRHLVANLTAATSSSCSDSMMCQQVENVRTCIRD